MNRPDDGGENNKRANRNDLILYGVVGVLILAFLAAALWDIYGAGRIGSLAAGEPAVTSAASPTLAWTAPASATVTPPNTPTPGVAPYLVEPATPAPPTTVMALPSATALLPLPMAMQPTATAVPPAATTIARAATAMRPTATPQAPAPSKDTAVTNQQIAALEAVAHEETILRTGQISATMALNNGSRSVSQIAFDLGAAAAPPRLHSRTWYAGDTGASPITERVTVGDVTWQRTDNNPWNQFPEQEGVWGQVQSFLPHASQVSPANLLPSNNPAVLQWVDSTGSLDVTLELNAETRLPKRLTQFNHATGSSLAVDYVGWNVPVDIRPPH